MYHTHTVLFLDYNHEPDHDTYTATCIQDAVKRFEQDHPGRSLIFCDVGLYAEVKEKFVRALGRYERLGEHVYEGVVREEQTNIISAIGFTHTYDEPSYPHQDAWAIQTFDFIVDNAQDIRNNLGGFGLDKVCLVQVFPYRVIKEY